MSEQGLDVRDDLNLPIPAGEPAGRRIAVFHLAWAPLGVGPFQTFLDSYRRRPAGMPHDLVILFKGFPEDSVPPAFRQALDGIAHYSMFISEYIGMDIASYRAAAGAFDHEYLVFLNSYSEILDAGWLAKYYAHAASDRVGAVAATASWGSPANTERVIGGHAVWSVARGRLARIVDPLRIARRWRHWRKLRTLVKQFPPFPNPHLRTNGFMIRRDRFLGLKSGRLFTKPESMAFECGWSSMTRQLLDMNLDAVVVGRDGRGYAKESWYESRTFRAGGQRNLLVADNRTREFEGADPETKRRAAFITWGDLIDDRSGP